LTIDLKPEHQRLIERAIQSGAFHDPDEVIGAALERLTAELDEDAEDVRVSRSPQQEQSIPLAAVKADLIDVPNGAPSPTPPGRRPAGGR
jgi:Arc/MetJ-type ribon-helix-helix transcriptional regulator